MPDIYIDSITIENFGPFYGETTLQFGTLEDRCGILIGGKTGVGKTHLLRSLYLAVVGESGVYDLTTIEKAGTDATTFKFDRSLNRKAASEGNNVTKFSVDIIQREQQGAGSKKLTFCRNITHRPNSPPRWESFVLKPDGSREEDEAIIQRLRDSLLPRHLARFFFFDAERSQSLFLGDKDIIESVSRILGLWTYNELAEDLRNLVNLKIPRTFNSKGLADEERKLSELSSDIIRAEGQIKAENEREQDNRERQNEIDTELNEIEEELRTLGSVDPEDIERKRQNRDEIKTSKDKLESELGTSWETVLPIVLLGDYRTVLNDYLIKEEKRNEWERNKATVEPKIPQVKSDVFEKAPPEFALEKPTYEFYSDRLDKALRGIFNPPPDGMSENVFVTGRVDISAQVRQKLSSSISSARNLALLSSDIEKRTTELREIDTWLRHNQQDLSALKRSGELRERSRNLDNETDQLKKDLNVIHSEQKRLAGRISELKREEKNQTDVVEKAKKGRTLATLAARYRETAEEVQKKAAIQLREKIGEHVGELWVEITERDREFLGMEFDKNWNCLLLRRDGQKVSWEDTNTSAGQRQVRVLAFYEALRRLARLVPPLVIDTPLSRLDREVRSSVLEKLYLSGHQSIILATNSEIDPDGPLFDTVKNRIARAYTLEPHGEPDSIHYTVSISYDYFGKKL